MLSFSHRIISLYILAAAESKFLVTGDCGKRGGKSIALKKIVDNAREKLNCESVLEKVLVWERFYASEDDAPYEMKPKDVRMDVLVAQQRPYAVAESMDAEDNLFILYTVRYLTSSPMKFFIRLTECLILLLILFPFYFISVGVDRKAKGASAHVGRICTLCCLYFQNHF